MKITANSVVGTDLPIYDTNEEAIKDGLSIGSLYRTTDGSVKVIIKGS